MDRMEPGADELIAAALGSQADDRARMQLFQWLADNELVLALDEAPGGDEISPASMIEDHVEHVIVFTDEAHLSAFADGAVQYCAIAGRALFEMLSGQNLGLSVNPGNEASITLPPDVVVWIAEFLEQAPLAEDGRITHVAYPQDAEDIAETIIKTLSGLGEWVEHVWLVQATVDGAGRTVLCALPDLPREVQANLSKAIMEAVLVTAGVEKDCDVAFFAQDSELFDRIKAVGMKLALERRPEPVVREVSAPGTDPDKPPRLI